MVGGHQAPIATPPPITHYSPHPTPPPGHSPFLSGEMRAAARWLTLPDASQLVAVTAAVAPPALTAQGGYRIESVIRYASRPLSMLELNTSPLADCEESNRLLHAWLRYPWLDPPFGLRR